MKEKLKIHELMEGILADLRQEKYADYTVGSYRQCYDGLTKFIEGKNVPYYYDALAIEYLQYKFGITFKSLYDQCPSNVRPSIRALKVLSDYATCGVVVKKGRPGTRQFECPSVFSKDYESFKLACKARSYAPMGEASLLWSLHRFLKFMDAEGLASSAEMTSTHILRFLTSQKDFSSRYIATTISRLRNYLNFLCQEGITKYDLSKCLPHMKISIIMQKTKQQLELPLLEDVGWAIIDYLKNGRPETKTDHVFIRHRAPYDGFADNNCLQKMLIRHMVIAKIDTMDDQKHGLHSLRSTLALTLLENGTPLPVISEALGHQNIQTTRFYLKIDMNGLRNCVIDPEEVCHE